MKNIVTDLLEYEKRKDNTEWFDEECTQLFTQRIKHTRHIQPDQQELKEWNISEKESGTYSMQKEKDTDY